MDFLSKITVLVTFLATLIVSATYGSAVEPPRRLSRSHKNSPFKMQVGPEYIEMRRDDVIRIKCKARIGRKIEEMPFINFFRKLDVETVLPMSSGFPGVTIETIASHKSRHNRIMKYMTLGPEVYQTLYHGDNVFYCKASNMNGDSESSYFVVQKV